MKMSEETTEWLKATPQVRWIKYWAGRSYKQRLEQRYERKDGSEKWIEVPVFLEEKSNN
jgi:hypothetical protein